MQETKPVRWPPILSGAAQRRIKEAEESAIESYRREVQPYFPPGAYSRLGGANFRFKEDTITECGENVLSFVLELAGRLVEILSTEWRLARLATGQELTYSDLAHICELTDKKAEEFFLYYTNSVRLIDPIFLLPTPVQNWQDLLAKMTEPEGCISVLRVRFDCGAKDVFDGILAAEHDRLNSEQLQHQKNENLQDKNGDIGTSPPGEPTPSFLVQNLNFLLTRHRLNFQKINAEIINDHTAISQHHAGKRELLRKTRDDYVEFYNRRGDDFTRDQLCREDLSKLLISAPATTCKTKPPKHTHPNPPK